MDRHNFRPSKQPWTLRLSVGSMGVGETWQASSDNIAQYIIEHLLNKACQIDSSKLTAMAKLETNLIYFKLHRNKRASCVPYRRSLPHALGTTAPFGVDSLGGTLLAA